MSKSWAGGSTRRWRRIRAFVLDRDGYRCQVRLPGCTGHATEAHHLDGKARGDHPARVVASCRSCNNKVGDPATYTGRPAPKRMTRW